MVGRVLVGSDLLAYERPQHRTGTHSQQAITPLSLFAEQTHQPLHRALPLPHLRLQLLRPAQPGDGRPLLRVIMTCVLASVKTLQSIPHNLQGMQLRTPTCGEGFRPVSSARSRRACAGRRGGIRMDAWGRHAHMRTSTSTSHPIRGTWSMCSHRCAVRPKSNSSSFVRRGTASKPCCWM